jgi:hypothetical protein
MCHLSSHVLAATLIEMVCSVAKMQGTANKIHYRSTKIRCVRSERQTAAQQLGLAMEDVPSVSENVNQSVGDVKLRTACTLQVQKGVSCQHTDCSVGLCIIIFRGLIHYEKQLFMYCMYSLFRQSLSLYQGILCA